MPRLAFTLAVCLLFTAPRSISARTDWDSMSPLYLKSLVVLLSSLDSTNEHFHFVKKEDIDLKVVMPGLKVPEGTLGVYIDRDNSMYLNRAMLLEGAEELKRKGTSRKEIPKILAWKTLHIVVHEIRHGMNARGLVAKKGFRFPVSYIEDEYIAFIDQMSTIHEVLAVRPELWELERILDIEKNVAILIQAQRHSVDGLKALVRAQPRYAKKPSVLSGHKGVLKEVRRRETRFNGLLLKHREELARKYKDPVELEYRVKIAMDKFGPTLRDLRDGRKILEDERKYKALRSFVRREMRQVVRKLESRRAG
ncbi:MAG: hypothetical protein COB53_11215 [Elusimicrobia bacterium]|nr:MAG: hypothetical protein COB53_11215 [Elusimicrobiota bacterium]